MAKNRRIMKVSGEFYDTVFGIAKESKCNMIDVLDNSVPVLKNSNYLGRLFDFGRKKKK